MNVALILQIGQIVSTLGPLALDMALKIQKLLAPLGPDITINIKALSDDAIAADEDTAGRADQFLASH
ncbi:MAG TPA: hypothetical protein VG759_20510 [Candidatus Angelobacter sp.]|jgi:hypothetical protein|nr:hypothetical protein [Candidatus Angelobacter sp.]